jgi:hypothetical protein
VLSFRARGIDEDISYVHAQSTSLSQVAAATTFWNIGIDANIAILANAEIHVKKLIQYQNGFRIASAIAGPE